MTKERLDWYQKEIHRLRELDKLIANKARATYSIQPGITIPSSKFKNISEAFKYIK